MKNFPNILKEPQHWRNSRKKFLSPLTTTRRKKTIRLWKSTANFLPYCEMYLHTSVVNHSMKSTKAYLDSEKNNIFPFPLSRLMIGSLKPFRANLQHVVEFSFNKIDKAFNWQKFGESNDGWLILGSGVQENSSPSFQKTPLADLSLE